MKNKIKQSRNPREIV